MFSHNNFNNHCFLINKFFLTANFSFTTFNVKNTIFMCYIDVVQFVRLLSLGT